MPFRSVEAIPHGVMRLDDAVVFAVESDTRLWVDAPEMIELVPAELDDAYVEIKRPPPSIKFGWHAA